MKKRSPVIWLTGMSGSGKTTLSNELEELFVEKGYSVRIVDGGDVRAQDDYKLGFGHADVMINNMRIAALCNEVRSEYDAIIVPVISPYNDIRLKVRAELGGNFHLVYLKVDIESLRARDPKGLYAKADRGEITGLIGYSDINPYDEPKNADLVIETGNEVAVEDSKNQLFKYINTSIFIDKYLY